MKNMIAIVLGCIILASCGVKPGHVDPPEGSEETGFPRTYPDLDTDPKP